MTKEEYGVIIVGSGPAGVSASLYTARGGIKTLIIGKDGGALQRADKIENYYGFSEPVSAATLYQNGIDGAKRLGVAFIEAEVVGVEIEEAKTKRFTLKTTCGDYSSDNVILATGAERVKPKIKGLSEYEGAGVSYCAVCDAFFYRKKTVAVIGNGEYAVAEAETLAQTSAKVYILLDGSDSIKVKAALTRVKANNIIIDARKIKAICGGEFVERVEFDGGEALEVDGVFVALGVASASALARSAGAVTKDGRIKTDEEMKTNIDGLYAAGDCTGGILQISKAVYEGARAGLSVIKALKR